MSVQELINKLSKVKDKSKEVEVIGLYGSEAEIEDDAVVETENFVHIQTELCSG